MQPKNGFVNLFHVAVRASGTPPEIIQIIDCDHIVNSVENDITAEEQATRITNKLVSSANEFNTIFFSTYCISQIHTKI